MSSSESAANDGSMSAKGVDFINLLLIEDNPEHGPKRWIVRFELDTELTEQQAAAMHFVLHNSNRKAAAALTWLARTGKTSNPVSTRIILDAVNAPGGKEPLLSGKRAQLVRDFAHRGKPSFTRKLTDAIKNNPPHAGRVWSTVQYDGAAALFESLDALADELASPSGTPNRDAVIAASVEVSKVGDSHRATPPSSEIE